LAEFFFFFLFLLGFFIVVVVVLFGDFCGMQPVILAVSGHSVQSAVSTIYVLHAKH